VTTPSDDEVRALAARADGDVEIIRALAEIARDADATMDRTRCAARVAPIAAVLPGLVPMLASRRRGDAWEIQQVIQYVGLDAAASERVLALIDGGAASLAAYQALCYQREPDERAAKMLERSSAADASDAEQILMARRWAARRTLRGRPWTSTETISEWVDDRGVAGYVHQRWDPVTRTYEMLDALVLGRQWVPFEPSLAGGKGLPRFTLETLRVMSGLRVPRGGIETLILGPNMHVESVLQFAEAERQGASPEDAFAATRAYASTRTPLRQTHHDLLVGIVVQGGRRAPLRELLGWHANPPSEMRRALAPDRRDEHAALLDRYGRTPEDEVWFGYEVQVRLEPSD
jgi:hypothetical protein